MSASLVGSEMCIRDSRPTLRQRVLGRPSGHSRATGCPEGSYANTYYSQYSIHLRDGTAAPGA
eukprot:3364952-Alexandrium_andersonii.AAC.1